MNSLLQDLRFAIRSLLRHPLFTAIGVLTLALGIGLNTAVFSAVEALLLRPLAGTRAPEEVVQIYRTWPGGQNYGSSAIPHYFDVKERAKDIFANAAVWDFEFINLSFGGQNERALASVVSASYFPTLGIEMARGRAFTQDEDVGPGAHPVAILSYSAWQRKFGSDPQIVGKQLVINGQAYTVVGITGKDFIGV
ncbi:MAG: ABC transporter permease, partial [Gemmatimonadaceae bacterium]